jgi:hypothetical protein
MTHASVMLPMVYEPSLAAVRIGNVIEAAGIAGTYRWIAADDPGKLYAPGPSLDLHPASPRTWIAAQRRETG